MYNEERKTEYLKNKKYNFRRADEHIISAENVLKREFNNAQEFEEVLKKDLSNFTKDEILYYYKSIKTNSLERLMLINSHFKNYSDWCGGTNYYNNITQTELRGVVVDNKDELITREKLLKMLNKIQNVSNKFLLLGLFEGICGKEMIEISCVCDECLDVENKILVNMPEWKNGEKKIYKDVSPELYKLAKAATKERFYYSKGETYLNYDKLDPRAIKQMENAKELTEEKLLQVSSTRYHMLMNRLYNCKNALNNPYITRTGLVNCGKVQMISDLFNNGSYKTVRECIVDNKKKIEDRYGKFSSIQRFLLRWEQYIRG